MRTSCGCGWRFTTERIPYRPRYEKHSAAEYGGDCSSLRLEAVVLQPAVERAARDAQLAGGLAHVARAARERPLDQVALRLVQRHRLVELARLPARAGREEQVLRRDPLAARHQDRPLHRVLQLAHVAGPRVAHQRDRKSTRLNSSHITISYAVFCLKK